MGALGVINNVLKRLYPWMFLRFFKFNFTSNIHLQLYKQLPLLWHALLCFTLGITVLKI